MKWLTAWTLFLCFSASTLSYGGDDFDIGGFINQEGKAEAQAFLDGISGAGQSVVNSVSNTNNQAAVTGNDYVEGALQQGVKILGKGVVPELPIADAASAAGSYAGGDTQGAADTVVAGTMGAIAGWGAAGIVEGFAVEGVIAVGTISAPAWVPALIVGATVGMVTKGIYSWMLTPPTPESVAAPQPLPGLTNPTIFPPSQPVEGGTLNLPAPTPPAVPKKTIPPKPIPAPVKGPPEHDHNDHNDGGGHHNG